MAEKSKEAEKRTEKKLYIAFKIALLLEGETISALAGRLGVASQMLTQTAQGVNSSDRLSNEIHEYIQRSFAKNKRKLGSIVRDYMP
jgi:hypothetical protein